jgi:hypothetical protein
VIQIDPHTLTRAEERGASFQEIEEVLKSGKEEAAKEKRKRKSKVFSFRNERNGKFYEQKKIDVIFVQEGNKIITITVYVFYGKFE